MIKTEKMGSLLLFIDNIDTVLLFLQYGINLFYIVTVS